MAAYATKKHSNTTTWFHINHSPLDKHNPLRQIVCMESSTAAIKSTVKGVRQKQLRLDMDTNSSDTCSRALPSRNFHSRRHTPGSLN
jgi:hypothetical protein